MEISYWLVVIENPFVATFVNLFQAKKQKLNSLSSCMNQLLNTSQTLTSVRFVIFKG